MSSQTADPLSVPRPPVVMKKKKKLPATPGEWAQLTVNALLCLNPPHSTSAQAARD